MKRFKKNILLYIGLLNALLLFFLGITPCCFSPVLNAQQTQQTLPGQLAQEQQQQQQQRRNIFDNYRVLAYFLELPDTLFNSKPGILAADCTKNAQETLSQPDLLKINDPFIVDVIKLKIADTLVKEKKYSQAETLIMSLDNSHGYLAKRITGLYLEILYFQQKYAHFIQRYEAAPVIDNLPNLHTQILYLNSLIKSGAKEKTEKAVGIFKKLFLNNPLKPFKELMSPADLSYCLQKMSYDEWFQKLTYLAEKNFFTEFLKEKAYLNSGQLVNLFYAEFYYKKKQYKKVEQSLCTVDNPKLRPYKQKLLIKIQLRRNN
ncbi:MAG TPA: hypothetical protein VK469_14865, partial [Candidatus Kapabacteria bacterium]|nr:hypothetical protein [Candidatus Kapabacteria bacterium]